mmetsp:Transcript_6193/g.14641  ORF Transcript_6193/g.14641 Transcript_6193/m.14641 type:complete len:82 (+) Transcript_6193:211-456(+)
MTRWSVTCTIDARVPSFLINVTDLDSWMSLVKLHRRQVDLLHSCDNMLGIGLCGRHVRRVIERRHPLRRLYCGVHGLVGAR